MLILRSNTWSNEPLGTLPEIVRATARRGGYDDARAKMVWDRVHPLWMKSADANGEHRCVDDTQEEDFGEVRVCGV